MAILSQLDVFNVFSAPSEGHEGNVGWIPRRLGELYDKSALSPDSSTTAIPMDGDSYEDYYATTPSTSHREPEWVTFATPICIGIAILICFAKIMCRNCSSTRGAGRDGRGDSLNSENSQQHWFVRSQQQFAQNSGIPPMIDAFFPAPPKYEDVMRAKEEESLEGGTPPRYSIQSTPSTSSSSDGGDSPSEHDAPPDYSTMARPATTRRITVATASIDDAPDNVVVVQTNSGRDNHAYANDSEAPPRPSSRSRNGARPVVLNVENLHNDDAEWEVARC